VSPGRAHQLVAGAAVAAAALRALRITELHLCPWALREGVILRRLDGLDSPHPPPRPWPLTDRMNVRRPGGETWWTRPPPSCRG
jgi:exopolyphosphatase / guanosine-5'-triphosphate,3'-diphosphate pyrophosphatase